jgi:hypothetical protein
LHDDDFDFDFSNNLRHEVLQEKSGDISDVETKGNKIRLSSYNGTRKKTGFGSGTGRTYPT